ncbi:MAG: rhodanese-like domain-containing protein [Lachnospiraceae bacterium]|jgi:thiosulfate sulfurtransferase|nr:rhodanese-like domain-containing protein [Lachnospiraceae bacterium]MCI9059179.1 rhodanese-like domain-containing protein [Lachnospiraceae bacterium]
MEFQTIGIREFNEYRKRPDAWVIDLRSKEEFEDIHVEGARNIPYEELEMFRKYLPKDKLYLLYCDRGASSLMAAKELSREGYRTATLVGGMNTIAAVKPKAEL